MPDTRPNLAQFLSGGGQMAEAILAKDWTATSLGPIDTWPQSLRTTVSLCLASHFPISIAWGPQRVQIYNDGYWPICAAKHPHSMGQDFKECWFSAWPVIGEAFEQAQTGQTSFLENQRMFLDRNGYLEETFFTFSFSPIRNETGKIGGIFHPVTETTARMLSERRTQTLRDLAARAAKVKSVQDVCTVAIGVLADCAFDLPFALLYVFPETGEPAQLAGTIGIERNLPTSPVSLDGCASTNVWPVQQVIEAGEALLVDLSDLTLGNSCGPYPERPMKAFVLPIQMPGLNRLAGLLIAGVSSRLPLDEAYRNFYELLAGHLGTAMANAHAYEEERRRAEALAELDRAKTTFFSNVSHEFRTPLTLMLGPLEDLLTRPGTEVAVGREDLGVVYRNGLRLLRLVNALLDFSRIEAGRVSAHYEPLDLAATTEGLSSIFRSAVEKAGMRLIVDCPPLTAPVYVDVEMWEKIVLNLLSNAFKFTFAGEIRVRLENVDGGVELSVSDTGTGIPPEEVPRLFERFHRVKNARGRTHEGSGIGLSLMLELVKLHGGSVRVQSALGGGSNFVVFLPSGASHLPSDQVSTATNKKLSASWGKHFAEEALRWLPEDASESSDAAKSEQLDTKLDSKGLDSKGLDSKGLDSKGLDSKGLDSKGLDSKGLDSKGLDSKGLDSKGLDSKGLVLLADDNADMRTYVQRLLSQFYAVEVVTNGKEALEAVQYRLPDLIVSDVMMPELDGYGLLAALRNNKITEHIPVILLSARAGEEARVEGLEAGADDYLVKPFSARELLARVRTNLELAQLRQKLSRESQERLRDSDERLRLAVASANLGTWDYDPITGSLKGDERFKAITGLPPDAEVTQESSFDRLHPEDRDRVREVLQRVLDPAGSGAYQTEYRTVGLTDGMLRHVYAQGQAVFATVGKKRAAVRFLGTVQDITERKRLEDQLLQAQKLESIGRLAGGVAHDFNNLLTAILGYAELAEEEYEPEGSGPGYLANVKLAAEKAAHLTGQLLTFARRQYIEPKVVQLNDLIMSLDKMLRRLIGENIELVMLPQEDLHCVKVDPGQFEQIVVNLVVNARDAMPDGGKITLETNNVLLDEVYARQYEGVVPGDYVLLAVSDTGSGMDESIRLHIFEPFFTTKEKGRGTGLGLATVYGIVRQAGGHIWLYSEVGQGTTFKIYLPRTTEAQKEAVIAHSLAAPSGGSELILLVEDEAAVRTLALTTLRRRGYAVLEAMNGEEALRVAKGREHEIDLLITDVIMPQMSGKELADHLQRVRPDLNILYTSGYTENTIVHHGVLEPGVVFLSKPFTPAVLAQRVREILDRVGAVSAWRDDAAGE